MILDFFNTAADLKAVQRQGWINRLGHRNPETVAEHVYSMAVMGMVFSDLEKTDTAKVLRMVLLHDLAESITGDITPDAMDAESKRVLENRAMAEILECLPEALRGTYAGLWDEFQQGASDEAVMVRQIDKLEMALQAKIYAKDGYPSESLAPFFDSARDAISTKNIKDVLATILKDARGYE